MISTVMIVIFSIISTTVNYCHPYCYYGCFYCHEKVIQLLLFISLFLVAVVAVVAVVVVLLLLLLLRMRGEGPVCRDVLATHCNRQTFQLHQTATESIASESAKST